MCLHFLIGYTVHQIYSKSKFGPLFYGQWWHQTLDIAQKVGNTVKITEK